MLPVPHFSCIFKQRLSDKIHALTNTQIKHILSTHFMYRVKRQTVRLSGDRPFVFDRLLQRHRRQVIRKQKLVGQILWLDAAAAATASEKQRHSASSSPGPDRTGGQSIKRLYVLLQNYWPYVKNLRRLRFVCLSHFFAPFPGLSEFFGGQLLM